ncbi:MAG: hypothetical protein AABZ39_18955 [Spirochaetota bacterium]
MRIIHRIALLAVGVGSLFAVEMKTVYSLANVKTSKEVEAFMQSDLLSWINSPAIITAVKAANEKNAKRTQAEITALDKEWMAAKDVTPFMKQFIENPVAETLREQMKRSKGLIAEAFVMDYQGCIVAEAGKTSDFWQGDEDKFTKSCTAGAIFVDKIKFDESSRTSSMQISLPLFDATAKKVVGAITVTVDMEKRALLKAYAK